MVGELTEKARLYENLAKSNNVKVDKNIKGLITDIVTYEEQVVEKEAQNQEKERISNLLRQKDLLKEYMKEQYGAFYFSYYNKLLDKLKPQYLTRALYLSSFMNYDNVLVEGATRHKIIYEEDLQRIFRLSRTETFKTKKELMDIGFLIINENKTLYINEEMCKKGDVCKSKKSSKARIFNEAIKEMYENSVPTEHRKLALLFKLLPYINLKHNIVCDNITEEIRELVTPLSLKTICEILDQKNITRFKKDLLSITVKGKPAVMIISVLDKNAVLINPSVYYKGTRLEDVEDIENRINDVMKSV